MKYMLWLLRLIVGALFIFSGLVKANDPLGLSYKMNEFFEVWGMTSLMSWSLALSVLMIGFEIISGIALLLGASFRIFSFLLLLLTGFFTFLTAYVYLTDKIKECGCFGDCIKISNAETFWKDVILLVLVIVLFAFRKRIQPIFPGKVTAVLMTLVFIFAFGVQWYTLNYLPVYDCLPYKVGTNIWAKMQPPPGSTPDEYESMLVYEKDGVQKQFNQQNYPWQDSTWKFVKMENKLVKKGNAEIAIKDFVISDYEQNNHTEQILREKGDCFLLFIKDVKTAKTENLDRIRELITAANQHNVPFYVLCASRQSDAEAFAQQNQLQGAQFMSIDVTVCKTAMRTNPGLMWLTDGTIRHKWSHKTYPDHVMFADNKVVIQ